MKKMENFFRRALSVLMCICMLMGNVGVSFASEVPQTEEQVNLDDQLSTASESTGLLSEKFEVNYSGQLIQTTLDVDYLGTSNRVWYGDVEQSLQGQYYTWYNIDVTLSKTDASGSYMMSFGFNVNADTDVNNSKLYLFSIQGDEETPINYQIQNWADNGNKTLRVKVENPSGGQYGIPSGKYRVRVGLPVSQDMVANMLNNGATINHTVTGVKVNECNPEKEVEISNTVSSTPVVTKTASVVNSNGKYYIRWEVHYTNGIKMNETIFTDTINVGTFEKYRAADGTSVNKIAGENAVQAYEGTHAIPGQEEYSNNDQTITFKLTGLNEDGKHNELRDKYTTDLKLVYFSNVPDGVDASTVVSNYKLTPNNIAGTEISGRMTGGNASMYDVTVQLKQSNYGAEPVNVALPDGMQDLYVYHSINNQKPAETDKYVLPLVATENVGELKATLAYALGTGQNYTGVCISTNSDGSDAVTDGKILKLDITGDGVAEDLTVQVVDPETVNLIHYNSPLTKTAEIVLVKNVPYVRWTVKMGGDHLVQNQVLTDTLANSTFVVTQDTPITITHVQDNNKQTFANLDDQRFAGSTETTLSVKIDQNKDYFNNASSQADKEIIITYYSSIEEDTTVQSTVEGFMFYKNASEITNTAVLPNGTPVTVSPEDTMAYRLIKATLKNLNDNTEIAIHESANPELYAGYINSETKEIIAMTKLEKSGNTELVGALAYDASKGDKLVILLDKNKANDTGKETTDREERVEYKYNNQPYYTYETGEVFYLSVAEPEVVDLGNNSKITGIAPEDFFQLFSIQDDENTKTTTFELGNDVIVGYQGVSQAYSGGSLYINTNTNEYLNNPGIYPYGYGYRSSNTLGIAGNFHLVGFSEIHAQSHINGNVLTKNFYSENGPDGGYVNNGTNSFAGIEVSYVQNFHNKNNLGSLQMAAGDDNDLLVIGNLDGSGLIYSNSQLYLRFIDENGNKSTILLTKPKNLMIDPNWGSTPFVDIPAVKSYCVGVANDLESVTDNRGITLTRDGSNTNISLNDPDGACFLNISLEDFQHMSAGSITGFSSGHSGSIVINIDCAGTGGEITTGTGNGFYAYVDDKGASGEVHEFDQGRVIYNFINAESKTIRLKKNLQGIILAPNSHVIADQGASINGSIIADVITVVQETHRTDFQSTLLPTVADFTAKKKVNGSSAKGSDFQFYLQKVTVENGAVTPLDAPTNPTVGVDDVIQIVYNNGGSVVFDRIDYGKEDVGNTYYYRVGEIIGDNVSYTYDTTVYYIKVDVKSIDLDDNYSMLLPEITYYKNGLSEQVTGAHAVVFTNKQEKPGKIDIPIQKVWEDKNDLEGLRPSKITVVLTGKLPDGTEVVYKEAEVARLSDKDNNKVWTYIFEDLDDKYQGDVITYTVREKNGVPGYVSEVTGNAEVGFTITNTHNTTETVVSGTKYWLNEDDDTQRPDSITICLMQTVLGGKPTLYGEKVVTAKDNWSWEWKNLPMIKDGKKVTYSIEEIAVPGYTSTVIGYSVYNKLITSEDTNIKVTKLWDDASNQDGVRPETITLHLFADGVEVTNKEPVVTKDGDKWTFTWEKLPRFTDDHEIVYTVTEDPVTGYTQTINGLTITNKHEPEKVNIGVSKVWNDADNKDSSRPASVTVHLFANDVERYETVLDSGNSWAHTWSNLPKYKDGVEIKYTVTEDAVNGYTTEITGNATNGFVVTNSHTASVSVRVPVKKTLQRPEGEGYTGPASLEGKFTFTLAAAENCPGGYTLPDPVTVTTATNSGDVVTFDSIVFTQAGTYTFNITESVTPGQENNVGGITNDTATKSVTIVVEKDNEKNELVINEDASSYKDNKTTEFVNTYTAGSAKASFWVQKVLKGANAPSIASNFTFTVTVADGSEKVTPLPTPDSKTNPTVLGGWVSFGEIEYDKPGTYIYNVTETGTVPSIINDATATKQVVVKVTDDGSGTLKAEVFNGTEEDAGENTQNTPLTFTNTYVEPKTAQLYATKTLEGRGLIEGEFSFELKAGEEVIQTVQNTADGTVTFDGISYTLADMADAEEVNGVKEKTFTYTISEVEKNNEGITSDTTVYYADVTVTLSADGVLTVANPSYYTMAGDVKTVLETTPTFTNTYEAINASFTINVDKKLENGEANTTADRTFTFQLLDSNNVKVDEKTITVEKGKDTATEPVAFKLLDFDMTGTYTYIVKEVSGDDKDIDYDETEYSVVIEIKDNEKGQLVVESVTVNEQSETAVNNAITVGFTNDYVAPKTAKLKATKTLEGKELGDMKFSFKLEDAKGKLVERVQNNGEDISFGDLTYTLADLDGTTEKTFTYTISEEIEDANGITCDTTVYYADVTVKREGNELVVSEPIYYTKDEGENAVAKSTTAPTFINTYEAEDVELTIVVDKKLVDKNKTELNTPDITGQFTFTLSAKDGAKLPEDVEATNTTGENSFGKITFTEDDLDGEDSKTFTYVITETGTVNGVVNAAAKEISFTVKDDGNGKLVIEGVTDGKYDAANKQLTAEIVNTYAVRDITVTKKWVGGPVTTETTDVTVDVTLNAVANGKTVQLEGVVNPVTLDSENDWTYTWEDLPEKTAAGVEIKYTVDETSTLPAGYSKTGVTGSMTDGFIITNTYSVGSTTATISVKKVLNVESGKGLTEPKDFTFQLVPNNNAPMPDDKEDTLTIRLQSGEANGSFGPITYTAAGTYTYTIKETSKFGGITNAADQTVTVVVEDKGDGTLSATVNGGAAVTFENTYNVTSTTVSFPVQKILAVPEGVTGPDITSKYTFKLIAEEGTPMPEITSYPNPAEDGGKVTFGAIKYTEPGNYTYSITETGEVADVVNDANASQTVTVTVVDNGDGTMTATATSTTEAPLTFTNTYVEPKTAQIQATKTLTGKDLTAGAFQFELSAKDGAPMPEGAVDGKLTVTNGDEKGENADKVTFPYITYKLSDMMGTNGQIDTSKSFVYSIREIKGEEDIGITYDEDIITAVVTVTYNEKNKTLSTSVAYENSEGKEITPAFENKYKAAGTSFVLKVEKELTDGDVNPTERTFNFQLYSGTGTDSKLIDTKEITLAKETEKSDTVDFKTLEYTEAGTYTYTVKEKRGTDTDIVYDVTEHQITVVVEDNGEGNLEVTSVKLNGNDQDAKDQLTVGFVNTYIKPIDVTLEAKKTAKDFELNADQFSFELTANDGAPMPAGATNGKLVETNDDNGNVNFGTISFTAAQAGIYTYTVKELVPEQPMDGVLYDAATWTVTVTVEKAEDGESLTKTVTYVKNDTDVSNEVAAEFVNKYVETELPGTKTWAGDVAIKEYSRPSSIKVKVTGKVDNEVVYPEESFEVNLTAVEGQTDKFDWKVEGLPKYINNKEVTYSAEEVDVDGYIKSGTDNNFINTLDPFQITVTKKWEDNSNNDNKRPDQITVVLYRVTKNGNVEVAKRDITGVKNENTWGPVTFDGLAKYDSNGKLIEYVIDELNNGEYADSYRFNSETEGIATSDSITVTAEKADTNDDVGVTITNSIGQEFVSVSVTKNWVAPADQTLPTTVKVQLVANGNPVSGSEEKVLVAPDWTATWGGLAKYANGQEINYSVKEVTTGNDDLIKYYQIGDAVKADNAEADANVFNYTITNTYVAPTEITLDAKKVVDGHALTLEGDEFTFQLKAGDTEIDDATNAADGTVTFDAIQYTLADMVGTDGKSVTEKVFEYTISEVKGDDEEHFTYDETEYTAEVKVTVVTDDSGAKSLKAELVGYTYKTKDGQEVTATEVVFTNTYTVEPTILELPVAKTLTNGNHELNTSDRTFKFELYEGESTTAAKNLVLTVKAGETQNSDKFSIKYTKAGTYKYTVKEVSGEYDDVVYDTTVYKVEVVVIDNNGKLEVSTVNGKDAAETLTFTNTYVNDIPVVLKAKKTLVDVTNVVSLQSEDFTFELTGDKLDEGKNYTAKNNADGEVAFEAITFGLSDLVNKNGEIESSKVFEYIITEQNSGKSGITHDEGTVNVTVTITQGTDNQLSAKVEYQKDSEESNEFTNTYDAKNAELYLSVSKTLVNGEANETPRTFTFQLSGSNATGDNLGTNTKTATVAIPAESNTPASATFDKIEFSKPGVYHYTITELKNDDAYADVHYDDSVYNVTVTVADSGNGELVVTETTYKRNSTEADKVAFENTYIKPIPVEFVVDKTLTGTDEKGEAVVLTKDQFTFELTGGKLGEGKMTATNNIGDDFSKAKFTTEAVFTAEDIGNPCTYTISEVPRNVDGYSYDTKAVTATVIISKTEDGKGLKATVTYLKAGSEEVDKESAKFFNTYELTELKGTKKWEGDAATKGYTRPTDITLNLYRKVGNGPEEPVTDVQAEITNKNGDIWNWEFKNLHAYINNQKVTYRVEEVEVDGYQTTTDSEGNFTNTLDTFDLPVKKEWRDNNDQDQCRPASIIITLKRGDEVMGTVTMAAEANGNVKSWDDEYIFTGLPKLDSKGEAINYTIIETINYKDGGKQDYEIRYQAYDSEEEVEKLTSVTYETKGVNVINSRETDYTSVSVEKKWLDGEVADNRGTIRVQLYADNVPQGDAVTLPKDGGIWEHTWPNLDVNKDGSPILYTVKELTKDEDGNDYGWLEFYQPGEATGTSYSYTITNTLLTDITITKNWDDQSDEYKLRPEELTIQLLQNNQVYRTVTIGTAGTAENAEDVVVSEDGNSWSYTFTGLPKYDASNTEYIYTVAEVEVPAAYESEIGEQTPFVINNTLKTVDIPVEKVWEDSSNQDGMRPTKVTLILMQNGAEIDEAVIGTDDDVSATVISEDRNTWSYTFEDLPELDANGTPYIYSVKEEVVYADDVVYTGPVDGLAVNENGTYVLRNAHTTITTEVTATKVWDDNGNVLDKRPESVTMQLVKTVGGKTDDVEGKFYELRLSNAKADDSNTWTYTFTDLDAYENGQPITYSVKETVDYADGYAYTSTYDEDAVKWTNKLEPTYITITKSWEGDTQKSDKTRPDTVQVQLYQNDELYDTYTITAAEGWSKTINDLPKYKSVAVVNDEIKYTENVYTIEEVAIKGYTSTVDADSFTVTNTLNTIDIDVTKEWDDQETNEAAPERITVELMQKAGDGEAVKYTEDVLEKDEGYQASFTGLPTHDKNGVAYSYFVKEVSVPGYTTAEPVVVEKEDGKGYDVTITNTIDLTQLDVTKVWHNSGVCPEVTLQLQRKAEGETAWTDYRTAVTLTDEPWTHTFEELPTHNAEGKAYSYTVKEATIEDYESVVGEVTGTAAEGYAVTVTNTELTEVKVTKKWGNVVGKVLPEKITVQLQADNVNVDVPVDLKAIAGSDSNEWESMTWTNLPKYNSEGKLIKYSVVETGIKDYSTTYNPDVNNDSSIEYEIEITNTFTPGLTSLTVMKNWTGDEGLTDLRPDSITVKLMVQLDGETTTRDTDKTAELKASDWTATFDNLPDELEGKAATYSVVEELADAEKVKGYKLTDYVTDETGKNVTLTNKLEVVDIKVVKDWQDDDNRDNSRPGNIEVQLYADGKPVGDEVVLKATGVEETDWSYQWNNLPKFKADDQETEISYTVGEVITEDMTNNGYESTVPTEFVKSEDGTYVFTIVNERDVDTFDLNGTKIWEDAHDQDGVRPEKVTITLETKTNDGEWIPATYADGTPVPAAKLTADDVDPNNADQWKWEFKNLPVNMKDGVGQKLTYRVTESVAYANGVTANYEQKTVAPAEFEGDKDGVVDVSITNAYEPKTTDITVNKSWSDTADAAKVRPKEIKLQLQQKIGDGEFTDVGGIVTLSADSNGQWQTKFENLPVYAAKGQLITYRVVETVTAKDTRYDYIVSGDEDVNGANGDVTIDLKNTLELVDVSVEKVWDDADNKFGGRPSGVKVKLWRNGDSVPFAEVTLDANNSWKHTFGNLPKCDANGNDYTYTVTEEVTYSKYAYTNGIAEEAVKAEGIEFAYKFNNKLVTTDLSGTKHWNDFDNKFDSRTEVTLKVLANGEQLKYANGEDVTIKIEVPKDASANDWSWEYKGLPAKAADGSAIIYSVAENDVIGYTEGADAKDANKLINTLETVTVTGTKVWADSDNQDGKRPVEVTLTLVNAPAAVENTVVTLSVEEGATNPADAVITDNSWSYTWTNLPKVDKNGTAIAYTVTEQVEYLDGYEYSESTNRTTDAQGNITVTLTNSLTPGLTQITVNKTWNDNGVEGKRPTATIHLMKKLSEDAVFVPVKDADGNNVTKTITGTSDTWSYTFPNLPEYENGKLVIYGVEETLVYAEGQNDFYYTKNIGEADENGNIQVTNTLELTEVTVTKKWEGESAAYDKTMFRPSTITFYLWQNDAGENVDDAYDSEVVTVTADDQQTYTFRNLPKYGAYGEIEYVITESADYTEKGYQYVAVVDGTIVTNTMTTTDLNGTKVWNDQGNAFATRPTAIEVVVKNGSNVVATKEFPVPADQNEFSWTIEDLPKYDANGVEIQYEVTETKVDRYLDGAVVELQDAEAAEVAANGIFQITNTLDTITVSGSKTWDDNNNQDRKRPSMIKIKLLDENDQPVTKLVDGEEVEITVDVTEADKTSDNVWGWKIEKLPKYDADGKQIVYHIAEEIIYDDDDAEYSQSIGAANVDQTTGNVTIDITNSYAPEETKVSVTKRWVDDNNREAVRPEDITLVITGTAKNMEVYSDTHVLEGEGNEWSYTFEELPKYYEGDEIIYTVTENEVDGYELTEEGNATEGFILINTHDVETISIEGKKIWDDESDRDGERPESVLITLKSDDPSFTARTEEVKGESDEWSFTFKDLPKYRAVEVDGKLTKVEVEYWVEEDQAEGYDVPAISGYNITNKREPDLTQIKVIKVWEDDSDRDDKRPDSIEVKLTAKVGDTEVSDLCQTVTLDGEGNEWSYTFTDLYVNHEGKPITYSVDEVSVPAGYEKTGPVMVDGTELVTYKLTNTHEVELVTIEVTKDWQDEADQDGKRPDSVFVQLYRETEVDGKTEHAPIGAPVELKEANNWYHKYNSVELALYRYENGEEIVYGIEEFEVPEYDVDINLAVSGNDGSKVYAYTVTNTHETETTKVVIKKLWADDNNQDGLRDEITFELYANGQATGKTVTLTKAELTREDWNKAFEDLDLYANGNVIDYTVKEVNVPDGYAASEPVVIVTKAAAATETEPAKENSTEVTITNTHEPELTKVVVTKNWDDDSNRDGMRNSIKLQLYANNVAVGEPVEVKAPATPSDTWTYTFDQLDRYENGNEINYTVKEVSVPEGYTASEPVVKKIEAVEATETTPAEISRTEVSITNKHEPVVTTVEGAKTWSDFDNQDGMRPVSITIKLMDGSTIVETKKVTEANGWKWSFTDLPKFRTGAVGEEIKYSIVEELDEASAAEYSITIDGYNVTNTHELETVEITGSKTWVDLNDKYLKRPDSVTIRLLADGVEIDSRKVTEADNWSWTFTGLPKFKAGEVGKEIVYTVQEDVVTGYITTVEDFNVTNSLNLVEFIKTDEQTGKRLPGAKFALYEGKVGSYDASKPVETWVSTSGTKILAGLKVGQTYTIVETEAPSGYAMMVPFQFTVQLSDIPGTYRAFSVSNCHVYRFRKLDSATNGLVHGAQLAIMDSGNNIIDSWWSSGDNNGWHEIVDSKLVAGKDYKLVELASPWGYELADPITFSIDENDGKLVINDSKSMGYDIVMYDEPWPEVTPTPEPTETSFTVTKRWEDKDNVLGLRPNSITVHLYRKLRTDAEYPTMPFMTVNMSNNGKDVWKFTFNNLPRRSADGVLYDYSIREELVEGYVVSYLNNGKTIVNSIPEEDFPPTPTPTLPYVTPTPSPMPRVPAGVQFVDGEWMYIDEYGIPLGGIPLTGDNTNFVLWGMAIGLPLLVAALAAVEIRRRKKLLLAAEDEEEVEETEA